MHINLSGKTAIITASTAGIGLATAKGLAAAGASVIVNGRTRASTGLSRPSAQSAKGAKVAGFVADLGDARGCDGDFFEIPHSEWLRFFEANVMSGVRLSRAYLPAMIDRGWGRVVFVSLESALNIPADMVHYGFTKTAQLSIARGLAKRVAGTGVTVNSVLPGPRLSEGVAKMLKDTRVTGQSLRMPARPSSRQTVRRRSSSGRRASGKLPT